MTARKIAIQFPGNGSIDDFTTDSTFESQTTWVIDVLSLFFNMLSMEVCTTRHWQSSSQLVQELNVCTVDAIGIVRVLLGTTCMHRLNCVGSNMNKLYCSVTGCRHDKLGFPEV